MNPKTLVDPYNAPVRTVVVATQADKWTVGIER